MNLDRLRALFIQEARLRMSSLVEGLLRLEQGTADEEVMESLLRQTHSLKGSAGLVGMHEVGSVAHELEDLVEAVRRGALDSGADVVDGMLALADQIDRLLDAGDATADPPPTPEPTVEAGTEPTPAPAPEPTATATPADHVVPQADTAEPTAVEIERSVTRLPVALHRLDDIVRLTGQVRSGLVRLRAELADLHVIEDDLPVLRELEQTAKQLQRTATAARTVPVSTLGARLQRAVRDAARVRGVAAGWSLQGGDTQLDRQVLQRLEDALLHMVRNGVAHGLEPADERDRSGKPPQGRVSLQAETRGSVVRLSVADDGRGLDRDALIAAARRRGVAVPDDDWTALVFRPGVTTATGLDELAGRGVGMDVVANAVRSVGGTLAVDTTAGVGTTITLQVPLSLAVTRCLEVIADGGRYALALGAVVAVLGQGARVDVAEGRPVVMVDGRSLPLLDLNRLLGRPPAPDGPIVILRAGAGRQVGLRVTTLVRQGEITVQALAGGMPANPRVLGTSIASDGSALVVLDPTHLLQAGHDDDVPDQGDDPVPVAVPAVPHLLVVDDALTIRELQRSILERAGYRVTTAEDGRVALAVLADEPVDLVITDVEMPRVDGFALTETIRQTPDIATTPVLILTTRSGDDDRRRGLEAGADGYLLKDDFTAAALLSAVGAQVGAP